MPTRDPLTWGTRGAIREYLCDGLESAWITKLPENEGDIAAQAPIVMRQLARRPGHST
jgi:hypothetical protein